MYSKTNENIQKGHLNMIFLKQCEIANKRTKQNSYRSQREASPTKQEPSNSPIAMPSMLSSPFKCSWQVHILIVDASEKEKHACVLLPSAPILHNSQ